MLARAAAIFAASAGLADAQPTPRADTPRTVRTALGPRDLIVRAPHLRLSEAAVADRAGDKPASAPDTVHLTERVILHAEPAVFRALRAEGHALDPSETLPRFALISAGSVTAAAALAEELARRPGVVSAAVETIRAFHTREIPTDPGIPLAWHLKNLQSPGNDINAEAAWARGYTGTGVRVGIMDRGVFLGHEDLFPNLDTSLCQFGTITGHGTSVAGIAVARGNNDRGAAGVAHNATFGQQYFQSFNTPEMPDEPVNAAGIAFRNDAIDIRNNSWGPPDNQAYHGLDPMEEAALELVATQGRAGKGGVLVWAAGNGGSLDRIEYDRFASSRHTIAIGAIDQNSVRSAYNERGSAMTAVSYSTSGMGVSDRGIYTAIHVAPFYGTFGGTSAAAPSATGALALALEANPGLTARDVKHILVNTAVPVDPADPLWTTNAAGHEFSDNYGFGKIDAGAIVAAAETWDNVGPIASATTGTVTIDADVPDNDPAGLTVPLLISPVIRVEHAEIHLRVQGLRIGDIAVELIAPTGTVSTLATVRNNTRDNMDHVFTSVKHWDELAAGVWTLRVSDQSPGDIHRLIDARLTVYGACVADQDHSGAPDPKDLTAWIARFNAGDLRADANGDRALTPADFSAWVRAYNLGC
jgi:subtilisin family serine protease